MKRNIKALLGGLVLSMVLVALFPSTFLKGDAKWTYKNDLGRIDVTFAGDAHDGKIDVTGKDLELDRPRFYLDDKRNQGIVAKFPVSYLRRSYQVTLKPRGNAKEISLVMGFRGKNFLVRNQRKPAHVRFENIRINGKTIAEEKTVWHDQSFWYRAKNISDNSMVTLNFDIRKPLAFTDIRWERLVGLFMACSLLISCSGALRRLFNSFNRKDIVQVITENYRNIDVVCRRSFWIIFGVLCFVFGFHAIQFMWGNHDWSMLIYPQDWGKGIGIGRYALYGIKSIVLGGIYLPLIYDVITFLFLALNAVLLCIYWKLERRVIYFVLCGLILTVQPFTLSMMYYVHMLPETFIGVTFALIALILAEKIAFEDCSFMRKVTLAVFSIVLINLSLAMYPVLLNTIAVAFVGRLLIQSFEWDGSGKQFRSFFVPYVVSSINIVLGILSYKIVLTFVFPPNVGYNTQTIPLDQIPERLIVLFEQSFRQLCKYTFPFISQGILWVFLGFTVLVVLYICSMGNIKQKIVRVLLLGGALFATQAAMMIANTHLIAGRIELFGLVVFETLMAVLIFTELKKLQNLSILVVMGVVWISIVNDLDCLRVWKLGFDAEKMLWNRVLARMEIQEDFDPMRKYKIIQIGNPVSLRRRFYRGFISQENALLAFAYDCPWRVFQTNEFYYPTDFIGESLRPNYPNDPKYKAQLKRLWEVGILDKAQAWPHENGLIVWKDVILFVTDAKLLEEYKKQLAQEFPRQPQIKP